ncbi:hypothetical protein DACRYDRAFT_13825 [Dacryopinax primogenitus]|uniref:Uncharacterized protein n=1 Tax=Dacryopinax primogenitus (strain DJM 731) TaxID=1858805 RepID=M5GDK1_DACPD|nr:uncharacterized protein DACRYDRAFT_13825 [Dacryopinax primogenitus]EJU04592.1 hypothetical protein DACRYDRAFT_13825 [Dacryopinax primogenitus]
MARPMTQAEPGQAVLPRQWPFWEILFEDDDDPTTPVTSVKGSEPLPSIADAMSLHHGGLEEQDETQAGVKRGSNMKDYNAVALSIATKCKLTQEQMDELLVFAQEHESTMGAACRALGQDHKGDLCLLAQPWLSELHDDNYSEHDVTVKHWVLKKEVAHLLGECHSWMLKKQCVLRWFDLRSTLDQPLHILQEQLAISTYPFKFTINHWAQFAFMRKEHNTCTEPGGSEEAEGEKMPKDYWPYLDQCITGMASRFGNDQVCIHEMQADAAG